MADVCVYGKTRARRRQECPERSQHQQGDTRCRTHHPRRKMTRSAPQISRTPPPTPRVLHRPSRRPGPPAFAATAGQEYRALSLAERRCQAASHPHRSQRPAPPPSAVRASTAPADRAPTPTCWRGCLILCHPLRLPSSSFAQHRTRLPVSTPCNRWPSSSSPPPSASCSACSRPPTSSWTFSISFWCSLSPPCCCYG